MKIAFLDYATLNYDGMDISSFHDLGDVCMYPSTAKEDRKSRTKDVDIIISNKVIIDKEVIDAADALKYIVVAATGYNNVDVAYARNKGIDVSNVSGYSTEAVVQQVFSFMLELINRISYYNDEVQKGRWEQSEEFCFYDHTIHELYGRKLGIYGYGQIGKRVSQVAQAFGMKVMTYVRSPQKYINESVMLVDEDTLLREADILTLHAPLNDDSKNFIRQETLQKMKPSAILINTARGGLVREPDLIQAVNEGTIRAAGIDTISIEPPSEGNILIGNSKITITPHLAWASGEARKRLMTGIINNITAYQSGKVINVVNG